MFVIGITGGSGSGKTSALRVLSSLGALALDCDEIYHQLLKENAELKAGLEARYGGVLVDGSIDRKRLGEIVFKDPDALKDLNAITHKYVSAEIERRIREWEAQGGTIAAIDAIALIESGRAKKCDITIGVTASKETRVQRIMKRDGITREQAEMRVNAQKPDSYYKENCDYLLEDKYETLKAFEDECDALFTELIKGEHNL
ncbi:MAG: dephospho-CoA kinase [Oscillospiraceae bacterium]|nr:dephospho-CoA kinase [Oscillospiraceae bacterium]